MTTGEGWSIDSIESFTLWLISSTIKSFNHYYGMKFYRNLWLKNTYIDINIVAKYITKLLKQVSKCIEQDKLSSQHVVMYIL